MDLTENLATRPFHLYIQIAFSHNSCVASYILIIICMNICY